MQGNYRKIHRERTDILDLQRGWEGNPWAENRLHKGRHKGSRKSQESLSELALTGGFPQLSHWKPGSDQINTMLPGSHSLCGERPQVPLDRLQGCQPGATLFRCFAPLIPEHLTVVEQR